MRKKISARTGKSKFIFKYRLAELVEGKKEWYIKWYQTHPDTEDYHRIKRTFEMNRYRTKKEKREIAKIQIARLNKLIPHGYPYRLPTGKTQKEETPLLKALVTAYALKKPDIRTRTRQAYSSWLNIFEKWANKNSLQGIDISDFTDDHAQDFLDDLTAERKLSPYGWNHYMLIAKTYFNLLKDRKYISESPFKKFKKKKTGDKIDIVIPSDVKFKIAEYIRNKDPYLFNAIQMLYYGYIRPAELRRLRIGRHIKFSQGLIFVSSDIAKDKSDRFVTMPEHFMQSLKYLYKFPTGYRVFSKSFKPGESRLHHDDFNEHFKKHVGRMKAIGLIPQSTPRLTFYMWKHTGITDADLFIERTEIRDQAGHATLKQTEQYLLKRKVRQSFKRLPDMLK